MKYAKADVGYVDVLVADTGKPCIVCRNYRPTTAGCSLVEGRIAVGGSCTRFEPMSAADYFDLLEEGGRNRTPSDA
jgi:hypothetical protein